MELTFKGAINTDYKSLSLTRTLKYKGHFINPKRLTNGNEKLHSVLVFDLPAVLSCPNCSSCKNTCYALQAQMQYADCRVFRNTNFHLAVFNIDKLQMLIENQLSTAITKVVRIHGSGDFFNQEYIDMWANIISKFPHKQFYAYTKAEKKFDFKHITSLSNFNLITSFIGGFLNYGDMKYCQTLKSCFNAFICPCGIDKSVKCGIDCNYCVENKNVCFLQH